MTRLPPHQPHLAALIDGELDHGGLDAAVQAISGDAELRGRFERGLMIGQVLRGEHVSGEARLVVNRVADGLAAEPIPLRARRPAPPSRSFNRPAVALALAASVAAVAVLVGPSWLESQTGAPESPALASEAPASESVAKVSAQSGPVRLDATGASPSGSTAVEGALALAAGAAPSGADPNIVARWEMDGPADSTALDALLVDHRERASASGLTGFIPYAAVVGQHASR